MSKQEVHTFVKQRIVVTFLSRKGVKPVKILPYMWKIAAHIGISYRSIQSIISDDLGYRKLSSWRKIREQTVLPRAKDWARYRTEGGDFSRHIVTGDETWVHHYVPESKQASTEWRNLEKQHRGKLRLVFLLEKFLQRFLGIAETYCSLIFSTNDVQLMSRGSTN